jgi:cytochrome c-type biogenesis protein CcmF
MGFGFALLGTFLVRSGVLTSVHAFAVDPRRGIAVLVLLGLALGAGFGLYGWRAQKLRQPAGFAAISRESLLVWNNFGLAIVAGVVLIGTLYPLIVEAVGGGLISVGPPFFNATVAPLLGLLFVLLPLGPMLTWRIGDLSSALKRLAPAIVIGAATLIAALMATGWRAAPAVGLAIGVWLIMGGLVYLWTRINRGEGRTLTKIAVLPITVWSMSLAHLGAGVLTIGAISETAFRSERAVALAPGQSIDFADRRITLLDIGGVDGPNYEATRARFRVDHDGAIAPISAERRLYETSPIPTSEVGILSGLDGDLYVALGEPVRGAAAWGVRLYHNPAVQFIFGGALMMAIGGLLSLIALAQRRRRAA